ncbi:hypothetical protein Csa_022663 [Cucumis sativus]|uniref:Uncharacterized protein n=1 Tax=Cucumis sativus TaxID=3659 RepID=A0A0A0KHL4_CUCSA|nr:hypothetical protein Csa_022663 [Cucumis sativus]
MKAAQIWLEGTEMRDSHIEGAHGLDDHAQITRGDATWVRFWLRCTRSASARVEHATRTTGETRGHEDERAAMTDGWRCEAKKERNTIASSGRSSSCRVASVVGFSMAEGA